MRALWFLFLFIGKVIFADNPEVWVIVHNSDSKTNYLASDKFFQPEEAALMQRVLQKLGFQTQIIGVPSLSSLGASLNNFLQPGQKVRGMTLLGHGDRTSYVHNVNEIFEGPALGEAIGKELRNVPLSPKLTVHLQSCFGACESDAGKNIQTQMSESLWKSLSSQATSPEQIDVIAHQNTSGGGTRKIPGLRWLVRSGMPRQIDKTLVKYGKSAYGILSLKLTPAVLGVLSPLLTQTGASPELLASVFVAGTSLSAAVQLLHSPAAAEVVTRTTDHHGTQESRGQILTDALKLASSNCAALARTLLR